MIAPRSGIRRGGRQATSMIDLNFPVLWLPTVPRAPRPLLPLRTHPSHSCNRRYRRRTPRPDLSLASHRRERPRDGCANSHETEDGPATGGRLLAKSGGVVSIARKVPGIMPGGLPRYRALRSSRHAVWTWPMKSARISLRAFTCSLISGTWTTHFTRLSIAPTTSTWAPRQLEPQMPTRFASTSGRSLAQVIASR